MGGGGSPRRVAPILGDLQASASPGNCQDAAGDKGAAGETSQAAASAISSGAPTRRNGVIASIRVRTEASASWSRFMSVAVKPGATALTGSSGPTSSQAPW